MRVATIVAMLLLNTVLGIAYANASALILTNARGYPAPDVCGSTVSTTMTIETTIGLVINS
jgi:hypothetical protein